MNGYSPSRMTLLYKPIGLIFGILSGLVAKRIFDFVWTKIDEEDPPQGTTSTRRGPRSSPRRRFRA